MSLCITSKADKMFKVACSLKEFLSFKASQKHSCTHPTIIPMRSRRPFLQCVEALVFLGFFSAACLYPTEYILSLCPTMVALCVGWWMSSKHDIKGTTFSVWRNQRNSGSVALFPCLHEAVTQGLGGSWYFGDYDWRGVSWWKISDHPAFKVSR